MLTAFTHKMAHHAEYRANLKKLREWLSKQQSPTFGLGLVRAMLEDKPAKPVYEYLGAHLDVLRTLDAETKKALAISLPPTFKHRNDAPPYDLSENGRAAIDLLRQMRRTANNQKMQTLLNAKSLKELQVDDYQLVEYVGGIIQPLLGEQGADSALMDQVEAIMAKAAALVKDAQRQGQFNTSYGDGTFTQALLGTAVENADAPPVMALVQRLMRDHADDSFAVPPQVIRQFGNELEKAVAAANKGKDTSDQKAHTKEAFVQLCSTLAELSGEGNDALFGPGLVDFMNRNLTADQIDEVLQHAQSLIKSNKHVDFMRELATAARLARYQKAKDKNTEASQQDLQKVIEHYQTLLDNDDVPLNCRAAVTAFLARQDLDAQLTFTAAHVAAAAYADPKVPVYDDQAAALLHGLRAHR